jgi:TctA family transporter
VLRGTGLGSVLGLLRAAGDTRVFASYAVEKKISDDPTQFGKGAIQGVAGPESANNAGAQSSFIPLLTLGIPENAVMALMVGAMTIHNIQPGPQVMTSNPSLFWGLIASMWIGNLMLVVLNLPLIGMWIQLLKVSPIVVSIRRFWCFARLASTPSTTPASTSPKRLCSDS